MKMYRERILYIIICTLCTVHVISSLNVTDITSTVGTISTFDPTDVNSAETAPYAVTTLTNIYSTSEIPTSYLTDGTTTTEDNGQTSKFTPTQLATDTSTEIPSTFVVPSTEEPLDLECDDGIDCRDNLPCIKRQAPTGPNYVCKCPKAPGNTYGFDCDSTFYRDFYTTIPLTTCYGPECSTGNQSSVDYPNEYKNRMGMMALVYVPGIYRFDLSFDERGIGIEYFKDDLVVGPGLSPPIEEIPGQPADKEALSGGIVYFNGFDTPDNFSIYGDTMWIWFATDGSITYKGFKLYWTSVAIEVTCPNDITIALPDDANFIRGGWAPPTIIGAGVGVNNLNITSNYNPNGRLKIGTYFVRYQYSDIFRHKAECNFRLTVRDVTRPVVEQCPGNSKYETCDGSSVNWTEPIAFDNSKGMINEAFIINRGSEQLERGLNIIVYTFADESGNKGQCRFEINIHCAEDDRPTSEIDLWIILVAAGAAVALLLLILAFFAHAKLAAIKAANTADLSFNPEDFQGHKPGAPLEEQELTNGNEKVGMYDLHGLDNDGAV